MEKTTIRIPSKVMEAMRSFYDGVDPHEALPATTEVMRMMVKNDVMDESDPDAEYFWDMLYFIVVILRAMQLQKLRETTEQIKDLQERIPKRKQKKSNG